MTTTVYYNYTDGWCVSFKITLWWSHFCPLNIFFFNWLITDKYQDFLMEIEIKKIY